MKTTMETNMEFVKVFFSSNKIFLKPGGYFCMLQFDNSDLTAPNPVCTYVLTAFTFKVLEIIPK